KYSSFLTNAAARVNLPALTTPIDENWRVTQNVPVPQPTVVAEAKTVQTGIPPQETAQVKALQMEVAQVEATQQETIHVKALQMEPAMQASSVTPESELSEILAPPALETNSETKLEGTLVQVASETAEIVEADDGTNYVAAEHTEEALDITSSSELESAGEYDLLSLEVAPTLSDDLSEQETEVHELHSPLEHEAKIVVQSEEEMPSDELDAVKTWGEAKTTPSPNLYHAGYAPKMPMLLDGYCPVTMVEANKWEIGNKEIFAHYANGVYFFASINAYEKFIQNPAYYALVSDGLDIVQLADNNQRVHGTRRFGIRYDDLNFVFATEENRDKFRENPDHYAKMARRIIAKEMEVETGRR
ncbi:MAG: hypothetical protein Q4C70_15295, partial [Planctomycetia bacterium]|nr:hypothetical protein [Planctomycetia bacterium]